MIRQFLESQAEFGRVALEPCLVNLRHPELNGIAADDGVGDPGIVQRRRNSP